MTNYYNLNDFKELIILASKEDILSKFTIAEKEHNYNHKIAKITHHELFKNFLKSHPSDQAKVIELCLSDKNHNFINLCLIYINPLFLTYLSPFFLENIISLISHEEFVKILIKLDSDDAVSVLEELDLEDRLHIISHVPQNFRVKYKRLLSYPEHSVGRIMDTDYVCVRENFTAKETLEKIRARNQNHDIREDYTTIIVVNEFDNFDGIITLANLVKLKDDESIKKYIDKSVKTVNAKDTQKDIAKIFAEYEYKTLPVLNKIGNVLGVVEDFAVIDYLRNENDDVILKSTGVFGGKKAYKNIIKNAKSRFTWLFVNLITAIISSFFISFFEASISQLAPLAVLMPIVASIGGNSGMQTSTITVRLISSNSINGMFMRYLKNEVIIGLFNLFAFGIVSFFISLIWYKNIALSCAFSISIMLVIITAVVCGFLIPNILNKFKIDPAIASSVFLTTVTDIVGFSGFLFLSSHFVL